MANPTIIIAHCAFHQAAHYETFTTSMNEAGFSRVHTSQLPSAGHIPPEDAFTKEVTVLLQAIASELLAGNDVMVLAHSYGGIPVTEALIEIGKDVKGEAGKILGIVFVAAMMPDDGENLATAMKTGVAPWVKIEVRLLLHIFKDAAWYLTSSLLPQISKRENRARSAAQTIQPRLSTTYSQTKGLCLKP